MDNVVPFYEKVETVKAIFEMTYPGNFKNDDWIKNSKKYNMTKISDILNTDFAKEELFKQIKAENFDEVALYFLKIFKRSPMINVFEKIALDNFLNLPQTRKDFILALYDLMYKFNAKSFEKMVSVLESRKQEQNSNAAKWPIITFIKAYQFPDKYYIVKPTTAKRTAIFFEIETNYTPRPTYKTHKILNNLILDVQKESKMKNRSLMEIQAMIFVAISQIV
jgi:hypothetical protein